VKVTLTATLDSRQQQVVVQHMLIVGQWQHSDRMARKQPRLSVAAGEMHVCMGKQEHPVHVLQTQGKVTRASTTLAFWMRQVVSPVPES